MDPLKFKIGMRIRISHDSPWAQGASGSIAEPPDFPKKLVQAEAPWQGHHRFVKGRNGLIEFYFVWFDQPQWDADGDGPYSGGEIEAEHIERIQ
jgi:hypothetical protein